MAKNLIQRPLIFQDESSDIYLKKGVIAGKSKSGKPEAVKKGHKSRNALNDITNKSTALPEEAAKRKGSQKELKVPNELNIAEERFLHDHQKCVEAQRSAMAPKDFLELVMPGCDSASPIDMLKTEMEMDLKTKRLLLCCNSLGPLYAISSHFGSSATTSHSALAAAHSLQIVGIVV